MVLTSMECFQGTGQLLQLPHHLYSFYLNNSNILHKSYLDNKVLALCPPMDTRTEKNANKFLSNFTFQLYYKGKILQLESEPASHAFIIVQGEVMSYKRLLKFESKHSLYR